MAAFLNQVARSAALKGAVLALGAVWLLAPALHAPHLEGYTANIEALAISWSRGDLWGQDFITPAIAETYAKMGVGPQGAALADAHP